MRAFWTLPNTEGLQKFIMSKVFRMCLICRKNFISVNLLLLNAISHKLSLCFDDIVSEVTLWLSNASHVDLSNGQGALISGNDCSVPWSGLSFHGNSSSDAYMILLWIWLALTLSEEITRSAFWTCNTESQTK